MSSRPSGPSEAITMLLWHENGLRTESIIVRSDKDEAYSVLLSKAEELSQSFSLDATKKQTGAKAMTAKVSVLRVSYWVAVSLDAACASDGC